jgi:lipoyl(octanoyl) transferase
MDPRAALRAPEDDNLEWRVSKELIEYPAALAFMEQRVGEIIASRADDWSGTTQECVWLLEHPPLYTGGTSSKPGDLLNARFPVFETGRGGQYTYHGPGQRVAYVMLDLKRRTPDIRKYVRDLEEWVILSLADLGVVAERREGRVGLWVLGNTPLPKGEGKIIENKIAAIGVRVRQWVTFHGVSINVNPDLSHYAGIVPCGIAEHGVTSLAALGNPASMADLDAALRENWRKVFVTL